MMDKKLMLDNVFRNIKNLITVPAEGNIDSNIMLVGEAGGREEEKQGRPFVGRAGKLLTNILEEGGVKREEVYITNVCKFRPPNNRKPNKKEIEFWKPYLLKEIEIIKPKIIILLGSTAIETLLGKLKVTQVHGKKIKKDEITYIPMFHPSAGLRFKKYKLHLEKDFKKLRSLFPKAITSHLK